MLPNAQTIIEQLNHIFVEQFELDPAAVVPEATLREDLELDSLDAADMLIAIEKKFGIRLDDNVAKTFSLSGHPMQASVMLCAYFSALGSSLPGLNFCAPPSK